MRKRMWFCDWTSLKSSLMLLPSHWTYCLPLGLSLRIYEFTFDETVKNLRMAASNFQRGQRHLPRPADHCIAFPPEYIDFRAYPKSVEVKAGLNRKTCAGKN